MNTAYPVAMADETAIILTCLEYGIEPSIEAIEALNIEALTNHRLRDLFRIIEELATTGKEVNHYTVATEWRKTNPTSEVPEEITHEQHIFVHPANLANHIEAVHEAWHKRRIMEAAYSTFEKGKNPLVKFDTLASDLEKALSSGDITGPQTLDGKQCSERMISDLERRFELQGKLSGIETGLSDFDSITDGLQYGEQTVIGARPSMGKTALGLSIAMHAAFNSRIPTLFISLEMSVEALMRRMCSAWCRIPMNELRRGSYTDSHFKTFTTFRDFASKSPLLITDAVAGLGINQLCAIVRRRVRKSGVKLVVIDYLQKIKASERQEKRTYEVGEVSTSLKALAVSTQAAFLTLAQLNRESEKETKKSRPPRLADLGDSKQIEQDADTVALIHRDRAGRQGESALIIAKQRDGETGIVNLYFNGPFAKFENCARVSPSDVPPRRAQSADD